MILEMILEMIVGTVCFCVAAIFVAALVKVVRQ